MDGDLGAMLQSVLSDPEQMARITQAAQSLMGGQPPQDAPKDERGPSAAPAAETQLLSALGRMLSSSGERSRSAALLMAMRPYMRPEKQEKLDRALKLAQLLTVVSAVMREYGGGSYGI